MTKNVKIRMPDARLVSVFQNNDPLLADIVRDRLEENGIAAVVDGEHQAGFAGVLPVKVMVRETDLELAKSILAKLNQS